MELKNMGHSIHRRARLGRLVAITSGFCFWLAGTAPVIARGCADPLSAPFLTCSVAECIALQADVTAKCKSPPPTRCSLISGCAALKAMEARFRACALSRDLINGRCWGGGDPGHQQASAQAWIGVSKCVARQGEPEPVGCADPCPKSSTTTVGKDDFEGFLEHVEQLLDLGLLEEDTQDLLDDETLTKDEPRANDAESSDQGEQPNPEND